MKNKMKLFGIIAIAALIGFSMAACDDGGGGGGASHLGDTPALSGQVYVEEWNYGDTVSYTAYTGDDLTVSVDGLTEKGKIENGQFSFTLGTPKTEYLESSTDIEEGGGFSEWEVKISPSNANFFRLDLETDSNNYYAFSRKNGNYKSSAGGEEWIQYIYVDKDCTISGKGTTSTNTEDGVTYTFTTKNFNLALKAGWNAVYNNIQTSITPTKETMTWTVSLSNSGSLKWVLEEW